GESLVAGRPRSRARAGWQGRANGTCESELGRRGPQATLKGARAFRQRRGGEKGWGGRGCRGGRGWGWGGGGGKVGGGGCPRRGRGRCKAAPPRSAAPRR